MTISAHLFKQMRSSVLRHQIAAARDEISLVRQIWSRSRNADCALSAAACGMISPPPGWIALPPRKEENTVISWLVLCYARLLCLLSHRFCCVFRGAGDSRNKAMRCDYVECSGFLCHSLLTPVACACRVTHTCRTRKALVTSVLS